MAIPRGSTPTNTFNVSTDLTSAVELYVTYKQQTKPVFVKEIEDCTVTSTKVETKLTRAETLKLNAKYQVKIQLDAKFPDGTWLPSKIITTDVYELLRE